MRQGDDKERRDLTERLIALLCQSGAALVGVGDLSDVSVIDQCAVGSVDGQADADQRGADHADRRSGDIAQAFASMKAGVVVAVTVPGRIVEDLKTAPTREYYDAYYELNRRLDDIVLTGERFLKKRGWRAFAQTTDRVNAEKDDVRHVTPLPHKTVATRAGLGWIGKSCLLVTPEFGSAVRISSLLTDAPLTCNDPIEESRCGRCRRCVDACPAGALKGTLWRAGMPRSELFDWTLCLPKQIERMRAATGIDQDLCGLCFAVCPYTNRALRTTGT